ncbi:MAG: hypothetical protein Q8P90_00630 [bacterium]|nr:hypothetical protein [bacterium]
MKTYFKFGALFVASAALAGCSLFGGQTTTPSTTTPTKVGDAKVEQPVVATTYKVGEDAVAGDITHSITSVELLDEIPIDYTLEQWDLIAEALPADDGFQWVHLEGEVTNNSKESQSVDSTSIVVMDADDNEFSVSTDTTIYVEDDMSPVYITVQPTQTVGWDGYFLVPADAEGLTVRANDLSFLPEDEVMIDLGL